MRFLLGRVRPHRCASTRGVCAKGPPDRYVESQHTQIEVRSRPTRKKSHHYNCAGWQIRETVVGRSRSHTADAEVRMKFTRFSSPEFRAAKEGQHVSRLFIE